MTMEDYIVEYETSSVSSVSLPYYAMQRWENLLNVILATFSQGLKKNKQRN